MSTGALAGVRNERMGLQAGGLALLAMVLWGGNTIGIKIGLQGMPPVAMAGLRFVLGALTVWIGALACGVGIRAPAGQWRGLAGLGAVFAVQIVLLNLGTQHTLGSRAGVLVCTYPFFTALFAHYLLPGDRLSAARLAGLGLSFAGVVLVFAESLALGDTAHLAGDVLVLGSGMLLGLRQVVLKRLVVDLHPFQVLFWQAMMGIPLFAALSLLTERQTEWTWSAPVVGAVLYQGVVVAGICFMLSVFLLRRHRASQVGAFGFVTPVAAVLLGGLLLDEPLSAALLGSMGLVAAGIALASRAAQTAPETD
ncbi:MAG: DMT family transporter [Candidatus Latescibacterota bacterium]